MNKAILRVVGALTLLGGMWTSALAQDKGKELVQQGLYLQKLDRNGEALRCFEGAGEMGDAVGQYYAGYCYLTGPGMVRVDDKAAVEWFKKSADQGEARAARCLASCYENGWGGVRDLGLARLWYQKAAQGGDPGARSGLERLGVSSPGESSRESGASGGGDQDAASWVAQAESAMRAKNFAEGVSLFRKAAESGSVDGMLGLGACYLAGSGVPQDPGTAAKWLRKTANAGNAIGQGLMGLMYMNGMGVKKDAREAVKWFKLGSEQGEPNSQKGLAVCYLQGTGVKKDKEKARELLQTAAAQGDQEAQSMLSKIN